MTCSTPRASPGAGSREASRRPCRPRAAATRSAAPPTRTSAAALGRRLHPPPQPVLLLRLDRQPAPPAADLDQRGRQDRPGQPQLRPVGVRPGAQGEAAAGGQLPEGERLPGRPRGLLRPDRRAALPGQRDQPDPEVEATGRTPRSSSPTTTPTAGTTTAPRRSPTAPTTPRSTRRCALASPAGGRPQRPLRTRPAAAAAGDLAVRARRTTSTTTPTEQASILRFIEDNWKAGRIGDSSFDTRSWLADAPVRLQAPALYPAAAQAERGGEEAQGAFRVQVAT